MNANFDVTLEGRGKLTVRQADYIAAGGEGSVYVKGDTALKIYFDPIKKIRDNRSINPPSDF
jgi:hypothetical protein